MFNGIRVKITEIKGSLFEARNEAATLIEKDKDTYKRSIFENLATFFTNIPRIFKLIAQEPEIIFFLFLQWFVIVLAYFAWIRLFQWIPDSVWQEIAKADKSDRDAAFSLVGLVSFAWSAIIIFLASYPLSLSNAAIITTHNLRACGKTSTLIDSLAIANKYIGKIWLFTFVDGFITVLAILDRLPKKRHNRTLLDELLYYAWKLSTLAIMPALLNGRNYFQAGKDSLSLIKQSPAQAVGLRFGYSAVCWIVGIASYFICILILVRFPQILHINLETSAGNYYFWYVMGLPIVISAGMIVVVVRPFYLLAVAKFYSDTIEIQKEINCDTLALSSYRDAILNWYTVVFIFILSQVLMLLFFGERLGWVQWIQDLCSNEVAMR